MFHRTERLLLRPFWPEDAGAVFAGINNPLILRNLSAPPCPYSMVDAAAFCALPFDAKLPNFAMLRRTNGAPQVIGSIGLGLVKEDAPDAGAVQIGYWLAQPHWGLGYTTEAARAVLQIAASIGLRTLIGRHFTDNPASGRVLRKIGFESSGRTVTLSSNARAQSAPATELTRQLRADDMAEEVEPRGQHIHALYYDSIAITDLAA